MHRRFPLLLSLVACAGTPTDDTDDTDVVDTDETDDTDAVDTDPETDETDDTEPPTPSEMDVAVVPATPKAGEALTCEPSKPGPALFRWEKDGVDAGVTDATVPAGRTDAYQAWTCFAATADGLWAGSGTVDVDETCRSFVGDGADATIVVLPDGKLTRLQRDFTIELWAWWAATPEVDEELVSHAGLIASAASNTDYALRLEPDGKLLFLTGSTADGCADLRVDAPTANGWHHLAGTWNATTGEKRLWVDGLSAGSCTTTDRPGSAPGGLYLGAAVDAAADNGLARPFSGALDEVRLSSNVRYGFGFAPALYHTPDADTVVLLHLNETGTFGPGGAPWPGTPDASGNGNHGKFGPTVSALDDATSTCDLR